MITSKEDGVEEEIENASGEGEQECWFDEGRCIESSKMESGSWNDMLPEWGKSGQPRLLG